MAIRGICFFPQQRMGLVLIQMTELAALVARDARADAYGLSAIKGFELEERLHL